jgi:DNA-binding XRE family transcriptional regulator
MEKEELITIREQLGKTQSQLAELLGVSHKAVQSFEQGWRNIPVHIERQVLFLLALKNPSNKLNLPCWVIIKCSDENRKNCPAWELQIGHLCWFINGTICQGKRQSSWQEKMKICRQCVVFQSVFPTLQSQN